MHPNVQDYRLDASLIWFERRCIFCKPSMHHPYRYAITYGWSVFRISYIYCPVVGDDTTDKMVSKFWTGLYDRFVRYELFMIIAGLILFPSMYFVFQSLWLVESVSLVDTQDMQQRCIRCIAGYRMKWDTVTQVAGMHCIRMIICRHEIRCKALQTHFSQHKHTRRGEEPGVLQRVTQTELCYINKRILVLAHLLIK